MAVLWKELANGGAYGDFRLLHDTADRLDTEPFAEAFYAAVQGAVTRGEVTPENARLLYELGQDSGRTDMAGQQGLLSAYRDQIHQAEEEARREADNKGRIYRMMGLAGGVSLALLLL